MERAAVRIAAWTLGFLSLTFLSAAVLSGAWVWWMAAAETVALWLLAFLQIRLGRIDMPILWLAIVVSTTMSVHLLGNPHRTGIGMGVAAVAAVGWVLADERRRRPLLMALIGLWGLQAVFPAARNWLMLYEAAIFAVMAVGLGSIGTSMRMSRDRYQRLFERAPIALWEEDFSGVASWLDSLRREGVEDLRLYLQQNPAEIDRALGLVNVLNVNPAAAALIEVEDASAMLGRLDPATFTAETRPAFLEQVVAVWAGDSEMTTEVTGATVKGRRIEAMMRWAAPPGPEELPDYRRVVVSITDVSELKAVERDLTSSHEALAAREQQVRAVMAGAPVILFAHDLDGIYTLAEGSGLEHLGETTDSLVGTSCFERNADRPEVLSEIRRALAGEESTSYLEDNGLEWEIRRRPILDEDGTVQGVIGVATDITERRRMEQALEAAQRRHWLMVRHVSDLLYTIDERGRIGFISPSVVGTLGYERDASVGMAVADLVHPDDLAAIVAAAAGTPPGASTAAIPHRVLRADGSWLEMEGRAANLLEDPELAAWVVTARDITERVEARRQLEAARDTAEAAVRAKSELLANVSHEIRTPMNAVLGMTDLALDTDLTDEQRGYVGTVRSSAESLLTIINDLLDLARVESGRLVMETVPFSVRGTLEDVMRTMDVRADQKGIGLEIRIDDEVPEWVTGDPGRLRQVVMNLMGNSVKFTDEGRVRVTASIVGGSLIRFDVADTGIGIAPEHLDLIFGAFEQADGSVTRRHGGTGLGLAISSKLVEAMGGTISVESRQGEGSVFSFTAELPETSALTGVGGAAMAKGPVLVIGDGPSRRRLVDMVAGTGRAAMGLGSAAEALTLAASLQAEGRRPGALIVDFAEPDVDYCRRLADSSLLAGVPMLVVVGAGRRGDGARFRAAGVRAYLTKPLGDADVREALMAISTGSAPAATLVTRHWLRDRRRPLEILLADDSATNRLLAARVLEKRGHRVMQVVDGAAAVEAVAAHDFDVVLMDVQMPEVDGLEATRAIREWEGDTGASRLPIIALTAHAMGSDRDICLAAGMDGYLAKPFRIEELASYVEAMAGSGRAAGAPGGEESGSFVDAYPGLVGGLEEAVAGRRSAEAGEIAARLAAGLQKLGAAEAAEAAHRLADAAQVRDPDSAVEEAFASLVSSLDTLEPELGARAGLPNA